MEKGLIIHFFVQSVHKQGTYFRFHNLALGLVRLGHKVRIFGAVYSKEETSYEKLIDGIEYRVISADFPLKRFFGTWSHPLAGLKRALYNYPKCDIAHVFQPHLSAYLPWLLNRKKAKKNFYDWDDLWTNGLIMRGSSFYDYWVFNQVRIIEGKAPKIAKCTTVCSHYLLNQAEVFGSQKPSIIYNGYWHHSYKSKIQSRLSIGLEPNAFYIGFMGRTVNELSWCYKFLERALIKNSSVRLALCGMPFGFLDNVPNNLRLKVDYLGFLSPEVVRDFSSSLDIGLLPLDDNVFNRSRFPIKFAEYLAAGTPVVCTTVGECSQIAKIFPSVGVSESEVESWISVGLAMMEQLNMAKWPNVDYVKLSNILSWENIISKLEEVYIMS